MFIFVVLSNWDIFITWILRDIIWIIVRLVFVYKLLLLVLLVIVVFRSLDIAVIDPPRLYYIKLTVKILICMCTHTNIFTFGARANRH